MRHLKILAIGLKPEDSLLYKGGKGATPEAQPMVAPTPPVEELGLEMSNEDEERRATTQGKSTLKVPLTVSDKAGLSTSSDSGLKV